MAEPSEAAPTGSAAAGQDVLLATKLHMPRPRPGFVPRPRLAGRLEEGLARGLVLVCAPAGSGKTVLLADWARRENRPVAWLSLDTGDNDPARFWRYVAAALDRVRPGIGEQVAVLLRGPQQPPLEAVVTTLINELVLLPGEVTIVLDDYNLIDAQPVHASIAFLLGRLPPGLRLVLASRADPPLSLARLRADGRLAELRADELRFTLDETGVFLREATGLDLPATSVAAFQDRTEGWVAGLQLAALSLRGQGDVAGFVATFSGSHRYVLDYLTEEVLAHQSEQVRGFLLETSVLDQLCGPLCDAVTGQPGSQALLETLERANLFLVALDEVRGWWRYHHLFADLLRVRLAQERPGRVPELHRAAAAWHEQHGLADDAVRHALAAGDVDWAARLIEQHVEMLIRRSEGETLRRWLSALPASSVRTRARLGLAQAVSALVRGQVEEVEPLLDDAERAFAATGDEPHEPSVGRALSVLANVPALIAFLRADVARLRGDAACADDFGRQALARLDDGDWLLGTHVRWNLAVANWLRGRVGQAERDLAEVAAERRAAGEGYPAIRVCYDLGQVQRAQGRLEAALGTYQEALSGASLQLPHLGMAHVGLAGLLYERDELAAALDHATRGVMLCRHLAFTQPLAAGLAIVARIRQARGEVAGALEFMSEAGQVESSPQVAALLNPVPSWQARLLLAQGDIAAATRWTRERGLGAGDEPSYPREPEYLVLARVLLARNLPRQALPLLERLLDAAVSDGRIGSVIEIRALQALALAADGEPASAVETLAEALTLGCPQGYVRVFADEGAPMGVLLGRLIAAQRAEQTPARGVPLGCLARLAQAVAGEHAMPGPRPGSRPGAASAVPGLVEQLTGRELEVLGMLAAGTPNQGIAGELVITLDTVKKHVSHVLGKLGAANRTEAVARARELGLIP
jgi:LuxR family transcriptional regulator, maltose regulon positive regulatory protein